MLIIGKKLSPYALLSISGLLAASDQAVKWLVQQSMAYGEYVSVTPFFNWVHLWNTGAAFSLCEWWRLAALLFYRNRGSGLDFSDQADP